MKKFFKFGCLGFISLIVLIIIIAIATSDNDSDEINKKDEVSVDQTEERKKEDMISWEDKVSEIAATDGTETEKYDAISSYARDYKVTEDEIKEFEQYIIQEYKDKKYLMNISNHEYMLTNLFKATIIENYYDDSEQNTMDAFAFDFLQNTKYNYRGVETMISDSTLANEEQMDEALAELEK